MVRPLRMESETGYYHVMMRGNNKEMIFKEASEKYYFIEQLLHVVKDNKVSIVAYCIMDNHVHLLVNSHKESMIQALKWINIKFAGMYNFKYERVGHVFQDRFKSEVINSEDHLLRVMRYIHNNPVKAKIVTNILSYKWSSYGNYLGREDKIINDQNKELIMAQFSNSMNQFEEFHFENELDEFLEIKEDLVRQREERGQEIINKLCQKYKVKQINELSNNKSILEEIIIELLKKSNLTHRRIGEITGTTRGLVHSISKRI